MLNRKSKVSWYRKQHVCGRCGCEWTDEWDCTCDDDCPKCGETTECDEYEAEERPIAWVAAQVHMDLDDYIRERNEAMNQ